MTLTDFFLLAQAAAEGEAGQGERLIYAVVIVLIVAVLAGMVFGDFKEGPEE